MFDFMFMFGDYESRKVARYESDNLTISTCSVNDGEHLYETGVEHPEYNNGDWVIVEAYDIHDEAEAGHNVWVERMTTEPLPEKLVDCANSELSQMGKELGMNLEFPRTPR